MTGETDQKQTVKSGFGFILIGVVLVVVALGFYFKPSSQDQDTASGAVTAPKDVAEEAAAPTPLAQIDVEAALAPRIFGDKNAPIKIEDFSSMTCGHCAKFHTETLPGLMSEYVDAGKAYVVFSDFPLNKPALDASMIARCLPADHYKAFVDELFAKQHEWGFDEQYLQHLFGLAKAAPYNMDRATFDACLASDELRQKLIARVEASAKLWGVNSTPTFVINNDSKIVGAQSFEAFKVVLDKMGAGEAVSAGETGTAE